MTALAFITQTGIRRPTVDEPFITLGTRVSYHHRCCEMRRVSGFRPDSKPYWCDVGKAALGIGFRQIFSDGEFRELDGPDATVFHCSDAKINKTLAIWPEQGEGVVIGLIRKGIGQSHSARKGTGFGSMSGDYDEGDPGEFHATGWVWLYVVKFEIGGIDRNLAFVPMDAAKPIIEDTR